VWSSSSQCEHLTAHAAIGDFRGFSCLFDALEEALKGPNTELYDELTSGLLNTLVHTCERKGIDLGLVAERNVHCPSESPIQVQKKRSTFHPLAQRNAFRRDARQQSRLFAPENQWLKPQPKLQPAFLRLSATTSQSFI
jgi:hypothetical protein